MEPNTPPLAVENLEVTEDDEYSENLERRRLFWVHTMNREIDEFLERVHKTFDGLPNKLRETFRHGDGVNYYMAQIPAAISSEKDADKARRIFQDAERLNREKGFRYMPRLYTSREHEKIGSSGHGGIFTETDPDVPIPLLENRLAAEGKRERKEGETPMTFEEVDRGRRLAGMKVLDPATQRVTDQIDAEASADPYHFLLAGERTAAKIEEAMLVELLGNIARRAVQEYEKINALRTVFTDYIDGKLSSQHIEEQRKAVSHLSTKLLEVDLSREFSAAKSLSFQRGKRDRLLSPQEILLRENSAVEEKYKARPYVPLAVQDGAISTEEAQKMRDAEASMVVSTKLLGYQMPFCFKLEKLDPSTGVTEKSPTFMSHSDETTVLDDEPKFREMCAGKLTVPFARPEDWHYSGSSP